MPQITGHRCLLAGPALDHDGSSLVPQPGPEVLPESPFLTGWLAHKRTEKPLGGGDRIKVNSRRKGGVEMSPKKDTKSIQPRASVELRQTRASLL